MLHVLEGSELLDNDVVEVVWVTVAVVDIKDVSGKCNDPINRCITN